MNTGTFDTTALSSKDLLAEANHRVANSLALLGGLVRMQARAIGNNSSTYTNAEIRLLFDGIAARIATIGQLLVGFMIMPVCLWLVNRPRPYLAGFILALVLSGVYSLNSSLFDLGVVLMAGLVGYAMRIFGFPFLPAVLGVVLCPLVESSYRRSLVLAAGDHSIFIEDRICFGLLVAAALFLAFSIVREVRSVASATEAGQGTP